MCLTRIAGLIVGAAVTAGAAGAVVAAPAKPPRAVYGQPDARGNPVTMDGLELDSSGTGFYVSRHGDFVTAFHVAGHCDRLAVLRRDGVYAAKTVAMDPVNDVAVVRTVPSTSAAALTAGAELAKDAPLHIERTRHLGGLASRSRLAAHFLRNIADYPPADFEVRAGAAVVGGNSGSPVVGVQGAVTGMVRAVSAEQPEIALVIGARRIAEVLQRAGVSFLWRSKTAGPAPAPGAARFFTFPILCYVAPPSAASEGPSP
jgi:S1-C subfamily serine protease